MFWQIAQERFSTVEDLKFDVDSSKTEYPSSVSSGRTNDLENMSIKSKWFDLLKDTSFSMHSSSALNASSFLIPHTMDIILFVFKENSLITVLKQKWRGEKGQ
jgi:hypothetical protein